MEKENILQKTLFECLFEKNKMHIEDTAIIYSGRKFSFAHLYINIGMAARAFHAMGVAYGDDVMICSAATPEMIYCFYGLSRIGAVVHFMSPATERYKLREAMVKKIYQCIIIQDTVFSQVERDTGKWEEDKPLVLLSENDSKSIIRRIWHSFSSHKSKGRKTILNWKRLLSQEKEDVVKYTSFQDKTPIIFTYDEESETGIPINHGELNELIQKYDDLGYGFSHGKRILNVAGFDNIYEFIIGVHIPLVGGTVCIIVPKSDLESLEKLVVKYKPNILTAGQLYGPAEEILGKYEKITIVSTQLK